MILNNRFNYGSKNQIYEICVKTIYGWIIGVVSLDREIYCILDEKIGNLHGCSNDDDESINTSIFL